MASLGEAVVDVGANMAPFKGEVEDGVDNTMSNAGKKSGKSFGSKAVGAMAKVLKIGVKTVGVAGAATLGTALFKGFGRLKAIEQAEARLSGLGLSAKAVSSVMENVTAAVKGTAFGLDEAGTAAAGALASGIKPGKQLTKFLALTGDAATQAGVDFNSMAQMMNKVQGQGKLTGDVVQQMAENGLYVMPMLAKAYGKPEAAMAKMVSAGKVDAKTFQKILQDNIGGSALKSGDTFTGAFANMMAALSRFGASLLTGLFPIAKQVFGQVGTYVDSLTKKVGPLAADLAAKLPGAFQKIKAALESVDFGGYISMMTPLYKSILGFGASLVSAGKTIAPALLTIWNGLAPILGATVVASIAALTAAFNVLGPAVEGVATVFAETVDFIASHQTTFIVLAGLITATLVPALVMWGTQATIAAAKNVAAWVTSKASAVSSVAWQVAGTTLIALGWASLGVQAAWNAAKVAGAWLLSAGSSMASAVASTATAVASTIAGWVMMGLRATANAIVVANAWALQTSAAIKAAVLHPIQTAKIIAGWVAMAARSALNAAKIAASWVATSAAAIAAGAVHSAQVAKQIAKWTFLSVKGAGKAAPRIVASWLSTSAAAIAAGAVFAAQVAKQVAGWVLLGAQSLLQAAKVAAAWLIAIGPLGLVIAAVVGLVVLIVKNWDTIKAATVAVWNAITGAISSAVSTVINFVKKNWPLILAILTGPIGLAVLAIVKNFDKIKAAGSAVIGWVTDIPKKLKGLAGKFGSAGKELIGAFINGLSKAAGFVGNFATTIWNGIKNIINDGIDKLNDLLEFTIPIKGLPDIHVDPRDIGHLARGTNSWRGGPTWVGENGPEILNLPRGSRVTSAGESERIVERDRDLAYVNLDDDTLRRLADIILHGSQRIAEGTMQRAGRSAAGTRQTEGVLR